MTLLPLLGSLAAGAFALGLLVAGIASSATATLAGQVVFEGFWGRSVNLFVRRVITLIPALGILAIGFDPFSILIVSQIVLSVVLPFALVPLVYLTARQAVMGEYVNGWAEQYLGGIRDGCSAMVQWNVAMVAGIGVPGWLSLAANGCDVDRWCRTSWWAG